MIIFFTPQGGHEIDQGEPAETHEKCKHDEEKHRKDQQIRQQREASRPPPEERRECPDLARDVVVDVEMAAVCPSLPSFAHQSTRPSPPTAAQAQSHEMLEKQPVKGEDSMIGLSSFCLLIACFCAAPESRKTEPGKGLTASFSCLIMQ